MQRPARCVGLRARTLGALAYTPAAARGAGCVLGVLPGIRGPRRPVTTMHSHQHDLPELFAQLGLPHEAAEIKAFIRSHRPLPGEVKLSEADFWSPAQAAFLRESMREDADWAPTVDSLNALLRA